VVGHHEGVPLLEPVDAVPHLRHCSHHLVAKDDRRANFPAQNLADV
jgi:hypothetical protein